MIPASGNVYSLLAWFLLAIFVFCSWLIERRKRQSDPSKFTSGHSLTVIGNPESPFLLRPDRRLALERSMDAPPMRDPSTIRPVSLPGSQGGVHGYEAAVEVYSGDNIEPGYTPLDEERFTDKRHK